MNPSISGSLKSLSQSAQDLTTDLMKIADQAQIENLTQTVREMQTRIAQLEVLLSEPTLVEDSLTDQQAAQIAQSLAEASDATVANYVQTFNFEWFAKYSPEHRVLFASKLLDVFHQRKAIPSQLWLTIVARQGF